MVSAPPRSVRSRGQGAAIHRLRRDGGRGGLAQRPLLITAEHQRGQLSCGRPRRARRPTRPQGHQRQTPRQQSPPLPHAVQARARVNMGRLITRRCEPINLFCRRNGRAVRRRPARLTADLRACCDHWWLRSAITDPDNHQLGSFGKAACRGDVVQVSLGPTRPLGQRSGLPWDLAACCNPNR